MTRYNVEPISFTALNTISIAERGGKVHTGDFARPFTGGGIRDWIATLPHILAGDSFRAVADAVAAAKRANRAVVCALGGHVIKCGLAPVLADLARRGFITAFAMNGAASIHDFEIAIAGHTSEDVEAVLPGGRFGAAEETGREMNIAIRRAAEQNIGIGEALGQHLDAMANSEFARFSLLHAAFRHNVPVTVHVAVGTDTPHTHPEADGAALGAATHYDFRLFCRLVAGLNDGGVFLNIGSAVVMPEVFLKAVSAVRNLGHPLAKFTTANFDFIQHYRPTVNVVNRPHADTGGHGYAITGHHEIMIPLLAAALIEGAAE